MKQVPTGVDVHSHAHSNCCAQAMHVKAKRHAAESTIGVVRSATVGSNHANI